MPSVFLAGTVFMLREGLVVKSAAGQYNYNGRSWIKLKEKYLETTEEKFNYDEGTTAS
eukprot:gene15991-22426_t